MEMQVSTDQVHNQVIVSSCSSFLILTDLSHPLSRQGEVAVLEFQTQQHKVISQIALAYALNITGKHNAHTHTHTHTHTYQLFISTCS